MVELKEELGIPEELSAVTLLPLSEWRRLQLCRTPGLSSGSRLISMGIPLRCIALWLERQEPLLGRPESYFVEALGSNNLSMLPPVVLLWCRLGSDELDVRTPFEVTRDARRDEFVCCCCCCWIKSEFMLGFVSEDT